ncbi:MAG: hypothetical protein F4X26_02240 [Chloroflexi bacterium]|nr:hypothetical protein [Chloroflexota bacterium]
MSRGQTTAEPTYPPGVALMPEDFAERLVALKERSGLPWERMAVCMGVDPRQLWRWRHGASPGGGAMLSLVRFATRVPDGLSCLLDEGAMVVRPERRN